MPAITLTRTGPVMARPRANKVRVTGGLYQEHIDAIEAERTRQSKLQSEVVETEIIAILDELKAGRLLVGVEVPGGKRISVNYKVSPETKKRLDDLRDPKTGKRIPAARIIRLAAARFLLRAS